MPDYEIRLYHSDGSLALVHVCHHDGDDAADAHARRLLHDMARYEIRRAGEPAADG
ncbi:MAG: hypothetical protein WDM86_14395 [Rhizomicrobium sp.]